MHSLFIDRVESIDIKKVNINVSLSHIINLGVVKVPIINRVYVIKHSLSISRQLIKGFVLWQTKVYFFKVWEHLFIGLPFHVSMFDHVFSCFPIVEKNVVDIIVSDFIL